MILTSRCNYNCCTREPVKEIPLHKWAQKVDPCKKVSIAGGEPLFYPEIEALLSQFNHVTLFTNLRLWKPCYNKHFIDKSKLVITVHEETADDEKFIANVVSLRKYGCNFEMCYKKGTCSGFISELQELTGEKIKCIKERYCERIENACV